VPYVCQPYGSIRLRRLSGGSCESVSGMKIPANDGGLAAVRRAGAAVRPRPDRLIDRYFLSFTKV
jgi:hypothetical protein